MDAKAKRIFQRRIISWYKRNKRVYPWRQTKCPFRLIIAEVTLKRTGAWKAEEAYLKIVSKYGTPEKMANADVKELRAIYGPLGLHSRADLLKGVATDILKRFNGKVPNNYSDLISIKGLGRYIANAVLCFSFDNRVPIVDGSVARVIRRCHGHKSSKEPYADKALWDIARDLMPKRNYKEYNLGLLDLGATICKPKKPSCATCPIKEICYSEGRGYESN